MLVLIGTGSIIIHDLVYPIGNLGIAIAFGGVVTAMIYAFGKISGAHINPAVSLGFLITKDLSTKNIVGYIIAQVIGAILASALLLYSYPSHKTLGTTLPIADWQIAFVLEFLLTFILMLVILIFANNDKLKKYVALAVGTTVGLEAYFAGPYTGASMNPARSIGPAIISGTTEYLWVYIVSTILGALVASFVYLSIKQK